MMTFAELIDDAERRDEHWADLAKVDFAIDLKSLMTSRNICEKELAERIGCTVERVRSTLRGDDDLDVLWMVRLSRAFGCSLLIGIEDPDLEFKKI